MRKTYLLIAALIAVIGIMMIVAPSECIKIAVIVLGITAIINGVVILFSKRNIIEEKVFKLTMAIRGVVSIAVGLLAVLLPLIFAGILWTVMVYAIGAYLLISASAEIYEAQKLKEYGKKTKAIRTEVIVSILLAIIFFCMPAKIGVTLIRIGGILLLIAAALCVIIEWKNRPLVLEAEILSDDSHENI